MPPFTVPKNTQLFKYFPTDVMTNEEVFFVLKAYKEKISEMCFHLGLPKKVRLNSLHLFNLYFKRVAVNNTNIKLMVATIIFVATKVSEWNINFRDYCEETGFSGGALLEKEIFLLKSIDFELSPLLVKPFFDFIRIFFVGFPVKEEVVFGWIEKFLKYEMDLYIKVEKLILFSFIKSLKFPIEDAVVKLLEKINNYFPNDQNLTILSEDVEKYDEFLRILEKEYNRELESSQKVSLKEKIKSILF